MSGAKGLLPAGFEALEPFAESWAVAGTANRERRRRESSAAERAAFYAVARDILPAALAHLDRKPLSQFDEQEERLMNMMLSLCHAALAIEAQGDHEALHAESRRHMRITKSVADVNA